MLLKLQCSDAQQYVADNTGCFLNWTQCFWCDKRQKVDCDLGVNASREGLIEKWLSLAGKVALA